METFVEPEFFLAEAAQFQNQVQEDDFEEQVDNAQAQGGADEEQQPANNMLASDDEDDDEPQQQQQQQQDDAVVVVEAEEEEDVATTRHLLGALDIETLLEERRERLRTLDEAKMADATLVRDGLRRLRESDTVSEDATEPTAAAGTRTATFSEASIAAILMIERGVAVISEMRRFAALTLSAFNSLALHFSSLGNNERALSYLTRAEAVYNAMHPRTAVDISSAAIVRPTDSGCLCEVCEETRRLQTAEREFEERRAAAELPADDGISGVETEVWKQKSVCDEDFERNHFVIEREFIQTLLYTSQLYLFAEEHERAWDYSFETHQRQLRSFARLKSEELAKKRMIATERKSAKFHDTVISTVSSETSLASTSAAAVDSTTQSIVMSDMSLFDVSDEDDDEEEDDEDSVSDEVKMDDAMSAEQKADATAASVEAEDLFPWTEWCENGRQIAEYYCQQKRFRMAVHCIETVLVVFEHFTKAIAGFPPKMRRKLGGEMDREMLTERKADLDVVCGRIHASILDHLYCCFNELKSIEMENEEEDSKEAEMEKVAVRDKYRFDNRCEELDASWKPMPKALELHLDFGSAKQQFLAAKMRFESALEYFKLDGFATMHTALAQNLSAIYKHLIAFVDASTVDTMCKMHKRRITLLSPIEKQLSPTVYLELCKELCFEIANCYEAMGSLRSDELEAMERQRVFGLRRQRQREREAAAIGETDAKTVDIVSGAAADTPAVATAAASTEVLTATMVDTGTAESIPTLALLHKKMKRMNHLLDKGITFFVRFIAYIEFPKGHRQASGGPQGSEEPVTGGSRPSPRRLGKLATRSTWQMPTMDQMPDGIDKDNRLDFLVAHFQVAAIFNKMHYADVTQQYKATKTAMHRYELICQYYEKYGPIAGFETRFQLSRQLRDLLPVKLNGLLSDR